MTPPGSIRIVLVDDHDLYVRLFAESLSQMDEFEVTGVFRSPDQAEEGSPLSADVVLLDCSFRGDRNVRKHVLQLAAAAPAARILMVSAFDDQSLIRDALAAGAAGYVVKGLADSTFLGAIRRTAAGERVLVTDQPLEEIGLQDGRAVALTRRESDVVAGICDGLSNATMAIRLLITESTVKKHVFSAMHKMGVTRRADVVRWVVTYGHRGHGNRDGAGDNDGRPN